MLPHLVPAPRRVASRSDDGDMRLRLSLSKLRTKIAEITSMLAPANILPDTLGDSLLSCLYLLH
jgi:hypothetical protein